MPTGYETRQGGRDSFAPQVIDPVQTTTGASGESRGVQQVGGESIGGVEGGQWTEAGNVAAGLGQFMEEFMAPIVARKQQAQFFKGFTEAQSGRALQELTDNDSPLTRIFGPSGFSQGAQFYAGQQAISEWQQGALADMDNLKRMSPQELSRYMADSAQSVMTGDPFADQVAQAGLLEAQGPVIQAITTARFAWQQTEARNAASGAWNAGADSLQQLVSGMYAAGGEVDGEAVQAAFARFGGQLQQPPGMTDETYTGLVYDFMRNNLAKGNFYAVRMMQEAGVATILDDDQQRQIEAGFDRYSARFMDEAFQDPSILNIAMTLDARIKLAEVTDEDPLTVPEIREGYAQINRLIRDRTGVDADYFDGEDLRSAAGSLVGTQVARIQRAQRRAEEIEDRNFAAAQRQAEREAEAAAKLAAGASVWATGNVNGALAIDPSLRTIFDATAMQEFNQGNYSGIARAFEQGGFVSAPVVTQAQSLARTGIGEEYTQATNRAYEMWQQLNEQSPALSEAYFGEDYDDGFRTFDMLVQSHGPQAAYREAFTGFRRREVPAAQRTEFQEAFDEVLDTGWFGAIGPYQAGHMNTASKGALRGVIGDHVARLYASGNPRPMTQLVPQAYNAAVREGRFEQYGELGWSNRRGTRPLGGLLGLTGSDQHTVISGEVQRQLRTVGVTDLDNVLVRRVGNDLYAEAAGSDGEVVPVLITYAELQAAASARSSSARSGISDTSYMERYRAARRAAETHIERRVPGESTMQRVTRINNETREWSRAHPPESYRRD